VKHCRNLRELMRALDVQESRAEILATPNYPRAPWELTDNTRCRPRDDAAEKSFAGGRDARAA
jgi:hypothetical protein